MEEKRKKFGFFTWEDTKTKERGTDVPSKSPPFEPLKFERNIKQWGCRDKGQKKKQRKKHQESGTSIRDRRRVALSGNFQKE